ncbi:MAG TPA: hypothetical protein VHI52_17790, partial [Verrucomicrobiae bacterium]|nr:hypothetical protein [Verrucomicrobiae bacterium]
TDHARSAESRYLLELASEIPGLVTSKAPEYGKIIRADFYERRKRQALALAVVKPVEEWTDAERDSVGPYCVPERPWDKVPAPTLPKLIDLFPDAAFERTG